MIPRTLALLFIAFLSACTAGGPHRATEAEVAALATEIRGLSPGVAPAEAARAAGLAFAHSAALARAYGITDPPLIHNAKVNAGTRPRGLCYHWAEDMEARLIQERFETLEVRRAIANAESLILIEHSTAVLVPRGAPLEAGIVLDPWRQGGRLFWAPVTADPRYTWLPREEALRRKGQVRYVQRPEGSKAALPRVAQ